MSNQNNINPDKVREELTALLKENSLNDITNNVRALLIGAGQRKDIRENPRYGSHLQNNMAEAQKTILQQDTKLQSHQDLSQTKRQKPK